VNVLARAASVLFVLCIPVLLVTTNVRLAANEERLYEYGFDKFDAAEATGLSDAELRDFAGQMITYFNSGEELLQTDVFTPRELAHLKDVKGLIGLAHTLQLTSLAYIALYIIANIALRGRALGRKLATQLTWGSGATIGLLAFFGFWAAVDFDSLFLLFHLVGFSNDLWQVNPDENMLRMFPPAFFNAAALFVAAAIIGEALIVGGAAWMVLRRGRKLGSDLVPDLSEAGSDPRAET